MGYFIQVCNCERCATLSDPKSVSQPRLTPRKTTTKSNVYSPTSK
jgi:hypothetical protein